jgi:DNA polymerase-3 subunit delta'
MLSKAMFLKETIIGNERAAQILEKGYKSGKLSHAYLFTGPEHLGKKTLALSFCKMLLNDNREDIQNNLDLTIISPDEDEKQITIEKIRDLEKKLALYPHSAKYKKMCLKR